MAGSASAGVWIYRGAYIALGLLIIFVSLIPLQTTPRIWTGPDVLLALTFAWVVRRGDYVPVLAIAGMVFLTDLLLQRPPGLWTAIVLIGAEVLRARSDDLRDLMFLIEWAAVSLVMILTVLAYRLILAIMVAEQSQMTLAMVQLALTIACYPLIVAFSHWVLGVRKAQPGQLDAMGRPL